MSLVGGDLPPPTPPDRAKRLREAEPSESSSDESAHPSFKYRLEDSSDDSPSSPAYSINSPPAASTADGDFTADVRLAVRRFEKAARAEFRALLQQGIPVQVAVERLLAKLSTGVRTPPSQAEIDALVLQSGLDREVASWALMLREELSRLRRTGTPPPDSVDVLTARLKNSNLDVEPPLQPTIPAAAAAAAAVVAATPAAAASLHPLVAQAASAPIPAAAEIPRKRAPDASGSSLEDESQKRRREEKDRMGAVLDAVAAAVRANAPAPPAAAPASPHLINALLRRSSQSELEEDEDGSKKRRNGLGGSDDVRLQKKTRAAPPASISVQNEG